MSLRLENLQHTYLTAGLLPRPILQLGPDWELAPGDQILLRGISGSGKTTFMNILAGLLRPTQGEVWLKEQALYQLSEAKRDRFRSQHIGYVFQSPYLLPMLNALENVVMPMVFAGLLPHSHHHLRALSLLANVGLAPFTKHRPAQLSTGQRFRVAVARALANHPHLLLADEPTAALDEASSRLVMDLLQSECKKNQSILIVASHDPALTERFSNIIDLRNGQLYATSNFRF